MAKATKGQGELPFGDATPPPSSASAAAPTAAAPTAAAPTSAAPTSAPHAAPVEAPHQPEPEAPRVLSVANLDRLLKRQVERSTANVLVQGEVSDLRRAGSGHCYFTLKDEREDAIIDVVMYRSAPARAHKRLSDGESVVLRGYVTFWAPRGRLQLVADDVLQSARGALYEAREKLRAKLAAEGLFDPKNKRRLPAEPRRIAVLTSRDGAAIHDFVRVAFRRGSAHILLVATPVQGAGAAERIARAIAAVDRLGLDAIVVTRGGGSAEDMAAYSDECVVRAIAAARTPIVSAVGHEVDICLADLAADARAATPSQAAELLIADFGARRGSIEHLTQRMTRSMQHTVVAARERLIRLEKVMGHPRTLVMEQAQRFDELARGLERGARRAIDQRRAATDRLRRRIDAQHPQRVLGEARVMLGKIEPRLSSSMQRGLATRRHRMQALASQLDALSPLAVLGRGYAIATHDGHVLSDAAEVEAGDAIEILLHRGRIRAKVEPGN